ncbi:FHA domain-containing protein [Leptothermofonsia sichuanensis]|uniref:FHA domain-containing protein n=1 Tax=Leptothermofonsia sichuanensis TaxID=2917832 RepID=UPI00201CA00B|nr:FHA domain-containing protein [Leptothermofonsia sichuanensis]
MSQAPRNAQRMPPEPSQKHLLIIEDDKGSRQLVLDEPVYSIGRDLDCDIRLASLFVSRRHATLVRVSMGDGDYTYRIVDGDLDGQRSANGLLINGKQLQSHDLQNEDKVVFGPRVQFTYFYLSRDPAPTEPPDGIFDDVTLINPRTADKSRPLDSLEIPLSRPPRQLNLIRRRVQSLLGFLNLNREERLRFRSERSQ